MARAGIVLPSRRYTAGVGWVEFVSRAIDALAWPLAAVVGLLLLRRQLSQLLARPLSRLELGRLKLEWDRIATSTRLPAPGQPGNVGEPSESSAAPSPAGSIRAELESLARSDPRMAIIEAHRRVERGLRALVESRVPRGADVEGAVALTGLAMANDLITPMSARSLEGLNVLRNLATHRREDEVSPGQAMEYLDLADAVLYTLRTPPNEAGER